MVQPFQVTLPDGLQTLNIFRQGMVRDNQDIVTGNITLLYAQFPEILRGIILPGLTDIFTPGFFHH